MVIGRERPWWGKYLWKRAKRIGFRKVADEVFLRLYWVLFRSREDNRILRRMMDDLKRDIPADFVRPPVHRVDNINSAESVALFERLAPDVCVLMVHPIIREEVFSIPEHGMLVFHPGVTPEYRGPHSAFWAVLNEEFWGIGWSLLRINAGIDTGQVLAQESAEDIAPLDDSHIVMQHQSHVEGLPVVLDVLRLIEAGKTPEVPMEGRVSSNYTHPGWSDLQGATEEGCGDAAARAPGSTVSARRPRSAMNVQPIDLHHDGLPGANLRMVIVDSRADGGRSWAHRQSGWPASGLGPPRPGGA